MQQYDLSKQEALLTSYSDSFTYNTVPSVLTPRNTYISQKSQRTHTSQQFINNHTRIVGKNTVNTVLCIQQEKISSENQYNKCEQFNQGKNCFQCYDGDLKIDEKQSDHTKNDFKQNIQQQFNEAKCIYQLGDKSVMLVPPTTSKAYMKGYRGQCVGLGELLTLQHENNTNNSLGDQLHLKLIENYNNNNKNSNNNSNNKSQHDVHFIYGCTIDFFGGLIKVFLLQVLGKFYGAKITCRAFEIVDDKIVDFLQENQQINRNQYKIISREVGDRMQIQGLAEFEIADEKNIEQLSKQIIQKQQRLIQPQYDSGHKVFELNIEENDENFLTDNQQTKFTNFCVSLVALGVGRNNQSFQPKKFQINQNNNPKNQYINTSLSILNRCLQNLLWSQKNHQNQPRIIPYRESKLTHIFRDVLHGHGKIQLIGIISDKNSEFDQNLSIIRLIQQATNLKPTIKHKSSKKFEKSRSFNLDDNNNNAYIQNKGGNMHALTSPTNSSSTIPSVSYQQDSQQQQQQQYFDRQQILELEEKNNQLLKVIQQSTQEGSDSELLATQLALTHQQLQQYKKENAVLKHELLNTRQHMEIYRQEIENKISCNNQKNQIESFFEDQKNNSDWNVVDFDVLNIEQKNSESDVFSVQDGDENDGLIANLNIQDTQSQ